MSFYRWLHTRDFFAPQDKLIKNNDIESEVLSLCFDKDSKYLAATYMDGQIRLYSAYSGRYHSALSRAAAGQDMYPSCCAKFRPPVEYSTNKVNSTPPTDSAVTMTGGGEDQPQEEAKQTGN